LYAQEDRVVLAERYAAASIEKILIPRGAWRPYPTAAEREPWQSLPPELGQYLVKRGEQYLDHDWPALPATLFLEYRRNGNRSRYQAVHFARRTALLHLVIAECVEGKGRFADDIANGVWALCEESFWGVPAHVGAQRAGSGLPDIEEPIVALFVAQTAELLAWTSYLLAEPLDRVSPLIRRRIQHEVERRVLEPCFTRDDFWWMGFGRRRTVNNWNPWCNANWLTCALLLEQDESRRRAAVSKILRSLDRFLAGYGPDGGCDEGPGYWNHAGGSLFDCLELLHSATGGRLDVYDEPMIREIGRYIYRMHIDSRLFVNFADAAARLDVSSFLIYRFGTRIKDPDLASFGAYAYGLSRAEGELMAGHKVSHLGRNLAAIFAYEDIIAAPSAPPLPRDVWLEDVNVMVARSRAGSAEGFFVAAKGGHNAESHNHNDVGTFILYLDGQPAIIDAGVETYRAQTFSSRRYEIWTMQSAYHNLPTFDGVMQQAGGRFRARDVSRTADDAHAQLTLDIAGAYPAAGGVKSWVRTVRLDRHGGVTVTDRYELMKQIGEITLSLMTVRPVTLAGPGRLLLGKAGRTPRLVVRYDGKRLTARTETIQLEDARLQSIWGDRLFRILLTAKQPPLSDRWVLRFETE
jgi:hypothetical protein